MQDEVKTGSGRPDVVRADAASIEAILDSVDDNLLASLATAHTYKCNTNYKNSTLTLHT